MSLGDISEPDSVLRAIEEFDLLGREDFLAKYGFGPSTRYLLLHDGREYDVKAIMGAAHGFEFPDLGPLTKDDFTSGSGTTVPKIRALGFEVRGDHQVPLSEQARTSNDEIWSEAEIDASVDGYLGMLRVELAGGKYVKSSVNQALRDGPLSSRSKGAVEFRMQNISYIMNKLGLPWIRGYKPATNVGPEAEEAITVAIRERGGDVASEFGPTDDLEALEKRARRLEEVGIPRPLPSTGPPERTISTAISFRRDPRVVAWVREQAFGVCELCEQEAPFISRGEPFLEVHHVLPLSLGGSDSVENAIAVCPNCHRLLHLSDEANESNDVLYGKVARLVRE